MLEASHYARVRIGETLSPLARVPLTQLGVWERFIAEGHAPSPGILSEWGQIEPSEEHFIFNAYGHGWHLDRARFDAMLASAAEQAGATVLRGARLKSFALSALDADWRIEFVRDHSVRNVRGAFLVDATGRASSPSRRQGARRLKYDCLVGVVGLFPFERPGRGGDTRTLIEACELGWWYSAYLPNGLLVVVFMTDADLLPSGPKHLPEYWRVQLESARRTRARVPTHLSGVDLKVMTASTEKLDCLTGTRFLAIGDAAVTFDPLSSRGICTALQRGVDAALAIACWSDGQPDAITEHVDEVRCDFERYLRTRAVYYGRERRWPTSAFWRRRQVNETSQRLVRLDIVLAKRKPGNQSCDDVQKPNRYEQALNEMLFR